MNFEDEAYVRLYTRKTLTYKLLGWEGRAVQRAMVDEFDEAGIFALRGDAAVCISVVTELPVEIVRVGLARLVETETWVVTPKAIAWPTYEEAQNCHRSDRLRQRASRKARVAKATSDVTPRAAAVTDVTTGHDRSQDVTLPPSAPLTPSPSGGSERAPTRGASPEPDPEPDMPDPPALPANDSALPQVPGLSRVGGTWAEATPIRRLAFFVPNDWQPNEAHRMRCAELRFDVAALVSRFRKTEFQRAYSDWDKRFDLWLEDERIKRETERGRASARPRDAPGTELDTTGAASAFRPTSDHRDFARHHELDVVDAAKRYRAAPDTRSLSTPEQERDFLNRLKCWALTGRFIPEGPLPRPPRKRPSEPPPAPKEATA